MKIVTKCIIVLLLLVFDTSVILNAQIIYTDLEPDVTKSSWDVYGFHLAKPDSTLPYASEGAFYLWKHPPEVVINAFSGAQIYGDANGYPYALNENDIISHESTNWITPNYAFLNNNGTRGNWINVQNKYIGLRFSDLGTYYYGWARLDIDAAPTYFTLKDYAYESSGQTILAGEKGAVNIKEFEESNISYRIINNEILVIENYSNEKDDEIFLYNILGNEILSERIKSGMNVIDLSVSGAGVYFIVIKSSSSIFFERIIIK